MVRTFVDGTAMQLASVTNSTGVLNVDGVSPQASLVAFVAAQLAFVAIHVLAITYISRIFFRDMRCFTMILFRRKFVEIWPLFVEILTVSRGFEPRAIEISHRRSHNHQKLSENLQILAF